MEACRCDITPKTWSQTQDVALASAVVLGGLAALSLATCVLRQPVNTLFYYPSLFGVIQGVAIFVFFRVLGSGLRFLSSPFSNKALLLTSLGAGVAGLGSFGISVFANNKANGHW